MPVSSQSGDPDTSTGPVLVFDGGCPFCRHFAERSELHSGIAGLQIVDGRSDDALRRHLASLGYPLAQGALVLDGDRVFHGAAAIQWLCAQMQPSAGLLRVLALLMGDQHRADQLYPLLLLARRAALGIKGLPVDPDASAQPTRP